MDTALIENDGAGWVLLYGLNFADSSEYLSRFKVAHLNPAEDDFVLIEGENGAALPFPPQNILALVSATAAGAELAAWCAEARLEIPIVPHTPHLPALLAAMSGRLCQAAGQTSQLMLRLAELRAIHEETQNSYNALRNYVSENGFAPPRLGFINAPDIDGGATLPETVTQLVQPLPVDLRSLCGFALHLQAPLPRFSEGYLHVELRAAEDDAVHHAWHVHYGKLTPGWITFAFEQAGQFWRKTPVLHLRFETAVDPAPLFSLGAPQLRADKVAVIDGIAGTRSLAFKTWQSIPGAPLTVSNQMWPAIRLDQRQISQIEIVIDEDLKYLNVPGQAELVGFDLVTLLANQNRLQVHPFENVVSVARLPRAIPAGASLLSAEVETGHENAGRIEYAIAALPPEDARNISETGDLPASAQISDWLALPPFTRGTVLLRLGRPVRATADLLLLTRLVEGENSVYGWAQFVRISLKGQFT